MKHLNKERFALDYELRGQKETIRRLEVVKREFIRERKRIQTERDERSALKNKNLMHIANVQHSAGIFDFANRNTDTKA